MLRYYKPEPTRLRPTDRMVAHTGFLTFARRIEPSTDVSGHDLLKETGALSLFEEKPAEEEALDNDGETREESHGEE
jgi:tRNA (adenine57-N1/adenine58-N1)-methyltransferase